MLPNMGIISKIIYQKQETILIGTSYFNISIKQAGAVGLNMTYNYYDEMRLV